MYQHHRRNYTSLFLLLLLVAATTASNGAAARQLHTSKPTVLKLPLSLKLPPKLLALKAQLAGGAFNGSSTTTAAPAPAAVTTTAPSHSLESTAVASGFALNGGKAAAHATASARQQWRHSSGGAAAGATSNATALANHASRAVAKATSTTMDQVVAGSSAARADAAALSDHGSAAHADAATLALGLGGASARGATSMRSAAVDGSRSTASGTTVTSAAGAGSSTDVSSDAQGAASAHGTAAARADSIAIGQGGSTAAGDAGAVSNTAHHGTALSHSLLESFSFFGGSNTLAGSRARADGTRGGLAASRDKSVGIGLWASNATTNTSSTVGSTRHGLGVLDSVIRSYALRQRTACADGINRALAELARGPQVDTRTELLSLGRTLPAGCLKHYQDLQAGQQQLARQAELEADVKGVPGYDEVAAAVLAGAAPALQQAASEVVVLARDPVVGLQLQHPQA